jgi:hypothetical protein
MKILERPGELVPQGLTDDPFHIRNFSGVMDEFCLFSRALSDDEIGALYVDGKPQPYPSTRR